MIFIWEKLEWECLALRLVWLEHIFWSNPLVKLFTGNVSKLDGCLFELGAVLVSFFGYNCRFVVANFGVQGSDQHQRLLVIEFDTFRVGLDSIYTVLSERSATIAKQTYRLENVFDYQRLEYVQLQVAIASSSFIFFQKNFMN